MKLSKIMEKIIKKRARKYKKMLETPRPEVDAIVAEIKESAKSTPKGMTLEEELAYINKMAITEEINRILKGGKE